jgi:hypothetical protein
LKQKTLDKWNNLKAIKWEDTWMYWKYFTCIIPFFKEFHIIEKNSAYLYDSQSHWFCLFEINAILTNVSASAHRTRWRNHF